MYRYTQVFPATNNVVEVGSRNIYRAVLNQLFSVLPEKMFKTKIIDFKDNSKNIFAYKDGALENLKEVKQIENPTFLIEFVHVNNNMKDTDFQSIIAPFQKFPVAYGVNTEMRGYVPIYCDEYGLQIFTSDSYVRDTFNIEITVQSMSDRDAMSNLLDVCVRQHYGYELNNIDVQFLLPNNMTRYLKEALFYRDLRRFRQYADESNASEETLKEMGEKIDYSFIEHLFSYSNGRIDNIRLDDKEFDLNLFYQRKATAYFRLESPFQANEANRRNELATEYKLTASGYIEYYNPMAFIVNVPSVLKGEFIDNGIIDSMIPDKNYQIKVNRYLPVWIEHREFGPLNCILSDFDQILFEELQLLSENSDHDIYPLLDKMFHYLFENIPTNEYALEEIDYNIYNPDSTICIPKLKKHLQLLRYYESSDKEILYDFFSILDYKELKDIKKVIKVLLWKDSDLQKEGKDYYLDDSFNIIILDTNDTSVYSFRVYIDYRKLRIWKKLKDYEEENEEMIF